MMSKLFLLLSFLLSFCLNAQVGIGTTTPHPSSILDIESTSQGVLVPRMSTLQRTTILLPAEGLLVFDTDENAFYYYDGVIWVKLGGGQTRDNYKLVKTVADLAEELVAGGGAVYELDSGTLYEINGEITLAFPIDLNNAYVMGEDTNEDKLLRAIGVLFSGSGGTVRNVTLEATGGAVFALSGSLTESFIMQNCIIENSTSVGSIANFGLVFNNVVQFSGNTTGITYSSVNSLLLNNLGWQGNNSGVYETYTGTFNLIEKVSGFSDVAAGATGVSVSTNPSVANGVLLGTAFSGAGTYVDGYTVGSYTGYSFTNDWFVNAPGITEETDGVATGDINLDYSVGSGATTSFVGTGTLSRTKLLGNTVSNNLFRFTSGTNNRITYDGKKTRYFGISASISFQGDNNNAIFIFYLAKNGVVIDQTKVYRENGSNNDVGAAPIVGTVELSPGDFIEVWAERFSGGGDLLAVSLNLIAR